MTSQEGEIEKPTFWISSPACPSICSGSNSRKGYSLLFFSDWNHCTLLFLSVGGPCEALQSHAQWDVIHRRGGVGWDGS
ncbi:hypothetical protein F7725_009090, partial [Dissostichus mawsoni]